MRHDNRLRKSDYFVGNCPMDRARRLIVWQHYAEGASNTSAGLHGLYRRSDYHLMGVAWWLPPTRNCAASWWENPNEVLSLSRLALLPETPKNAATFLLMNSVKLLDVRWRCLVTYADTMQGHTGHIYRAAGWEYCGLTKPEKRYQINGRLVSRKCAAVTRSHAAMLELGAEYLGDFAMHRFRLIRRTARIKQAQMQPMLEPTG